ncbi:MAG: hypothetical protein LBS52_00925, partial [Dysgonamonadaceae bacterium]|nr:hypothetical protein [Dysgonamonadaceae bacterium]
ITSPPDFPHPENRDDLHFYASMTAKNKREPENKKSLTFIRSPVLNFTCLAKVPNYPPLNS